MFPPSFDVTKRYIKVIICTPPIFIVWVVFYVFITGKYTGEAHQQNLQRKLPQQPPDDTQ